MYTQECFTFEDDAVAKGTNAGTYSMGLTEDQFTNTNDNFKVTFAVTDGKLTINPKAVTVTANDLSKVEGAADPTLTATVTGLLGNDVVVFTITREPGSTPGTYRIVVTGEEIQGNYIVRFESGTFTITAAPAPAPASTTPTPTPTPRVTTTPTTTTPVATPTLTPPETIESNPAPKATIDNKPAPKAEPETTWALINLLCTIATALISLLLLAFYFIKKKDDEDEKDSRTANRYEDESKVNSKLGMRLLGLVPAIGAIITFILTEDMSLKMAMTDKWTLVMVIILAIEAVVTVLSKKTTDDGDKEEQKQRATA